MKTLTRVDDHLTVVWPGDNLRRLQALFEGPARVWEFTGGVALLCGGVWWYGISRYHGAPFASGLELRWWELAIAFYLAEVFVVHLQFRKQAHTISLTEIGLVLGLFLASPVTLIAAQLTGTATALILNRRQRPLKLAFNLAELPLCTGVAMIFFREVVSPTDSRPQLWLMAFAAAAIAHTLGVSLVSMIIAIAEARFHAPQILRTLATSLAGAVATASLGLAAVELLDERALAGALLVIPVVACVAAFRGYMAQREQREHVEFLYESMRATQGAPEFGLAVGQLLVAARRMLRAEYAEILLLPPSETDTETPIRSVSGPEGELLMHPEEKFSSEDMLAFNALARAGGSVTLGRRRGQHQLDAFLASRSLDDAIVGPLRGENRTFGLLIVGDRAGDISTFNEGDADIFDTFSGHASVLLENGRLEHSLAQLTELKEELRHQAYHDALTGLSNRVQFLERVSALLEEARAPVAVLYLDLDRFKAVNDTWGHAAGDELLIEVARRLMGVVRTGDLAARLGGDEFAIVLNAADEQAAVAAADRVAEAVGGTYHLTNGEIVTHASIGIAVSGEGTSDADELVRNADIAMYSAKRLEGRAFALHEPALHEELRVQRQLTMDLEAAIARGQIEVHYQPILNLRTGQLHGFEALARWRHPLRGMLAAGEFLPTAEENGLIVGLGALVIEEALASASGWPRDLGLWLNLAPAELANERLVEDMALYLTRSGVDAARVTIEITESSLIRDEENALRTMRRLRDLGLHLTIDDFGTGYSSLSRLAEFPIESLKIPKPFVDKLVADVPDETFIDAILRLSESLGLSTVGEGIERPAQARRLLELGCEYGQGYHFGRPMPANLTLELIASERPPLRIASPSLRETA